MKTSQKTLDQHNAVGRWRAMRELKTALVTFSVGVVVGVLIDLAVR